MGVIILQEDIKYFALLLQLLAVVCAFCTLQGFSEPEVGFAKAVFSNLVGGISYFYGKSK